MLFVILSILCVAPLVLYFVLKSNPTKPNKNALQIAFIHPDLGIGGAERLIIDSAVALQNLGHKVVLYTGYCNQKDEKRCYPETRDGTLEIRIHGSWMPRTVFGRFIALCAYLRNFYVALRLVIDHRFSKSNNVIISDQISASIPLLKLTGCKILFYCHFPDMLLTFRPTLLKRLYRYPLDTLEEMTTNAADLILVNSNFTLQTFKDTFRTIKSTPKVLHPAINLKQYDYTPDVDRKCISSLIGSASYSFFLSFNRFEKKKNHALAIRAFAQLLKSRPSLGESTRLVVAGGYESRVQENVDTALELENLAKELKVDDKVIFLKSVTNAERNELLWNCTAVLYTPEREHFGIVPVECMYAKKPVIACNSGGPTESVKSGKTGWLCDVRKEEGDGVRRYVGDFEQAMLKLVDNPELVSTMGEQGRAHVVANFSLEAFGRKLNEHVLSL